MTSEERTAQPAAAPAAAAAAVTLDTDLGDLRARALAGTLPNPHGYVVALLDLVAAQACLMDEARDTIALANEVVRIHGGGEPPPAAKVALRRQAIKVVE